VIVDGVAFVRAARRVREHLAQAHRYAHTLRVARMAAHLAHVHGADVARARLAGMLHDLARLYPAERLLRECAARGMSIDPFERANPIVLHARLGAELAREAFGIDDEAVLSAIRKHTVGDAAMTPLDQILFLADGLEPGRSFPERGELAALAFRDLRAAMRAMLASTFTYLRERHLSVAPQMLAAARSFGLEAAQEEKRPA
jgi:predicted HD superfamily hydrolase involved in NAD metabolism